MLGMNRLPRQKRIEIISQLVEGMSLRAVTRTTGVSINTVTALLVTAGKACTDYQDQHLRHLTSQRVQVDEIWAFNYCKQRAVASAKAAPDQAGDIWTWTAIDADTKLAITWLIGSRDADAAQRFTDDLASRLDTRVQLTSDGYGSYLMAVWGAFGREIDYAQLVKRYGPAPEPAGRYSPAQCIGAEKRRYIGAPDQDHISTSYRRTPKPDYAHAYAAFHTADERLQQEGRKSLLRGGAALYVLQLLPHPYFITLLASHAGWRYAASVGDG